MACGSGAAATVCAGVASGRIPMEQVVRVRMAGGELTVTVHSGYDQVTVTGEAAHVFTGTVGIPADQIKHIRP